MNILDPIFYRTLFYDFCPVISPREIPRVGHSNMYLITRMRQKGIYHGAIYLKDWNCLHPIIIDKSKFCHFRWPYLYL
jgi:hypothetical protein